jgi:hypothetical protein
VAGAGGRPVLHVKQAKALRDICKTSHLNHPNDEDQSLGTPVRFAQDDKGTQLIRGIRQRENDGEHRQLVVNSWLISPQP